MNQRKAGVILSYVSMGLRGLIGFIYVPMLLLFLTKEQYGLYQLMGSLIAYLMIMDFGLANTTTRYYSRCIAAEDEKGKENLLAVTGIIYGFIALLIVLAGLACMGYIVPLFGKTLSPAELITAKKVFALMLFNIALVIPANIFVAVINAHQQFVFARMLTIINTLLQPLFVFILLNYKADVIVLVAAQTLCNLLAVAANVFYCFKKLKIRIKLHSWDSKFAKEIMLFSFFVFLAMIMDQVYWQTGQIILGAVAGTGAVAVYSIAVQLDITYLSFSGNLSSVFLPQLSALAAKSDDMTEINNIFVKIGRIQFALMSLILCGFALYGKDFILLWVGKSFESAYYYALVLMGALLIPLIQNTGISVLQAKNKHAFRSVVYFIIAAANILISIPMAKAYGGMGCALTTAFCLLFGQGLIINIYYAKVGIDIIRFFKEIITMALPVLAAFAVGLAFNLIPLGLNIFVLGAKIVAFTALFAVLMWTFGLNLYEKDLILKPLKRLLNHA